MTLRPRGSHSRFLSRICIIALAVAVASLAPMESASAAQLPAIPLVPVPALPTNPLSTAAATITLPGTAETQADIDAQMSMPAPLPLLPSAKPRAPRSLIPLYATFATLQALDVATTLKAINIGAAEANPVMAPFVNHPPAFVGFKAGITAMTIWSNSRLARKHPIAAVVVMVAMNSAYAAVVAHNYHVAQSMR